MLETQVQSAICEYLTLKRHFFTRVNSTGIFDPVLGIHRKPSKYTRRGMSDILLVHIGRAYFIEVKRPGGKQSPDQKLFQEDVEKSGGLYALVSSVDDIIALGL